MQAREENSALHREQRRLQGQRYVAQQEQALAQAREQQRLFDAQAEEMERATTLTLPLPLPYPYPYPKP